MSYSNPSFILYPSAYKTGNIYPQKPLGDLGTFNRNSDKTRVNSSGLIETIGNDICPVDYSEGSCPVFNFEPQSTNLILNSEPTSSEQSDSNITYESFSWANGYTNCVRYLDNSLNRVRLVGQKGVPGNTYTFSFWVITDDLTAPTVSSVGTLDVQLDGNTVEDNIEIKNAGNNIYRIEFTAVAGAGSTGIAKYTTNDSNGFRVVGWQMEALEYATSDIPTNGSTVTRLQDEATQFGDVTTFNSEEGVLVVNIAALVNDATNRTIEINDGTSQNLVHVSYRDADNSFRFLTKSNNSNEFVVVTNVTDVTEFSEFILKWETNNCKAYINGVEVGSDLSVNSPIGLNTLEFTSKTSVNTFFGKTKYVKVYKSIADAQKDYSFIS